MSNRMPGRALLIVAALFLLCPHDVWARDFEVRLLKGTEKNGVWGTEEFQVSVNWAGTVRHVVVHGKELIWQAASLYTYPVPPDGGPAPRTVQGESGLDRGLSVAPPERECRDDNGKRVFLFRCKVSNRKVLDGKPLCDVRQRIVITPTGEIHVRYDFEWIETIRWNSFSLLIFPGKETVPNRDYVILVGDRVLSGKLTLGKAAPGQKRIRAQMDQFTVWSEVGPFHFVWQSKTNCSLTWQRQVQLSMTPPAVPRRDFVYKGQKDHIAYTILLPVSQQ
ncbi:MAG: hypothetical protein GXP25_02940 [Planctomycetes bacterium]|nr:hypothetical protein [Planctomycetota bacterium]